ncbi:MAG: hypothetical protein V3T43_06180 [Nitrosomonadaceae bacterium]
MIDVQTKVDVEVKGIHTFVLCDARSERAQKLSAHCESIGFRRAAILYKRDEALLPLQLKASYLNKIIARQQYPSEDMVKEHTSLIKNTRALAGQFIEKLRELWEEYRYYAEVLQRNFQTQEIVIENITTTVGRAVFAQRLGGDTTFTGTVTHTALGSDNTAAVIADTTLGTETYRKAISSGTDASNVAHLETFFSASEVTGTFEEYANFIDGTGSADTGQMTNRFVSSITKSGTETLNVQSIITFNDA